VCIHVTSHFLNHTSEVIKLSFPCVQKPGHLSQYIDGAKGWTIRVRYPANRDFPVRHHVWCTTPSPHPETPEQVRRPQSKVDHLHPSSAEVGFLFSSSGWGETESTWHVWHCWLLYQPRMIDDDYGAVGGMRIGRGNRSTRRKPAPVPLCPPKNPNNLTWDGTGPPRWEACD
jgi:hypothetical protein